MFTIFSNPLLCLKQDDFKITQRDERKDTKSYIKVSLVLKIAFWFEILTSTRYYSSFFIEVVPSAVLSLTDYLKQKSILQTLYLLHFNFL